MLNPAGKVYAADELLPRAETTKVENNTNEASMMAGTVDVLENCRVSRCGKGKKERKKQDVCTTSKTKENKAKNGRHHLPPPFPLQFPT